MSREYVFLSEIETSAFFFRQTEWQNNCAAIVKKTLTPR